MNIHNQRLYSNPQGDDDSETSHESIETMVSTWPTADWLAGPSRGGIHASCIALYHIPLFAVQSLVQSFSSISLLGGLLSRLDRRGAGSGASFVLESFVPGCVGVGRAGCSTGGSLGCTRSGTGSPLTGSSAIADGNGCSPSRMGVSAMAWSLILGNFTSV